MDLPRPDYDRHYRPLDTNRLYQQQAQAHYESMRMQARYESMRSHDSLRLHHGSYMRGASSPVNFWLGRMQGASPDRYNRHLHEQDLYLRDATYRTFEGLHNTFAPAIRFGADVGLGLGLHSVMSPLIGRLPLGKFSKSVLSLGADAAGHMAIMGAIQGAARFAGVPGAFSQFQGIENMRHLSPSFMASGYGDTLTGRMSQSEAQKMMTYLSQHSRYNFLRRDGESVKELQGQVSRFSDLNLLEGVRSADDFARKFKGLKEAVRHISEALGTSFEEGTKLLADLRGVGMNPTSGGRMIRESAYQAAALGLPQGHMHAAGMRYGMGLQGTGLSFGAGYRQGIFAEGMGQMIQQQRMLSEREIFSLGGPDGLGQALQRGQMRYMQSTGYTAMLMSAFTGDGVDPSRLFGGLGASLKGASGNMSSLRDIMRFRAAQPMISSRILETAPEVISAGIVSQVLDGVRMFGQDPAKMSMQELAQYAQSVIPGMSGPEFLAQVAAVQASSMVSGRGGIQRMNEAESRGEDIYRLSPIDSMMRFLGANAFTTGMAQLSSQSMRGVRRSVYNTTRSMQDAIRETVDRSYRFEMSGSQAALLDEDTEQRSYIARQTRGWNPRYLFSERERADVLDVATSGNLPYGAVTSHGTVLGGKLWLSHGQAARLGLRDGPGDTGGFDMYSLDDLQERGISGFVGRDNTAKLYTQAAANQRDKRSQVWADFFAGSMDTYRDPSKMNQREYALLNRLHDKFNAALSAGDIAKYSRDGTLGPKFASIMQDIILDASGIRDTPNPAILQSRIEAWRNANSGVLGTFLGQVRAHPDMAESVERLDHVVNLSDSDVEQLKEDERAIYQKLRGFFGERSGPSSRYRIDTKDVITRTARRIIRGDESLLRSVALLARKKRQGQTGTPDYIRDFENVRQAIISKGAHGVELDSIISAASSAFGESTLNEFHQIFRDIGDAIGADGTFTGDLDVIRRGIGVSKGIANRGEQEIYSNILSRIADTIDLLYQSAERLNTNVQTRYNPLL